MFPFIYLCLPVILLILCLVSKNFTGSACIFENI